MGTSAASLVRRLLSRSFLLLAAGAFLITLPGCDSSDDGSDDLGDLSVRATTSADVSSAPVSVSSFTQNSFEGATNSVPFDDTGTVTLDLRDDVKGVEVTLIGGHRNRVYLGAA